MAVGEWQRHVLFHGQVCNQIEGLKNESDLLIAHAGPFALPQPCNVHPVEDIAPTVGLVQQSKHG
ncbi:hypothetical protein D3C81_1953660 [compost metagenome]